MSLEITSKNNRGVHVLALSGRLTFGTDILVFRLVFDGLVDAGQAHMAFNLNRLYELDVTGVKTLLYASGELQKAGGDLAIFGLRESLLDPRIEETLGSLRVFSTEQEAVESFVGRDKVRHYDVLQFVRSMKSAREHSQA
jgi:anti-anti-sigma regulatory factor